MPAGLMSSDANYPSNSGLQLSGASFLSGFDLQPYVVSMTISKTPGSSASYKAQTLIEDSDASTWVDVPNSTISGNGSAATGQKSFVVVGSAVRIVAVNGTSPGTGANTPQYSLNAYPLTGANNQSYDAC